MRTSSSPFPGSRADQSHLLLKCTLRMFTLLGLFTTPDTCTGLGLDLQFGTVPQSPRVFLVSWAPRNEKVEVEEATPRLFIPIIFHPPQPQLERLHFSYQLCMLGSLIKFVCLGKRKLFFFFKQKTWKLGTIWQPRSLSIARALFIIIRVGPCRSTWGHRPPRKVIWPV